MPDTTNRTTLPMTTDEMISTLESQGYEVVAPEPEGFPWYIDASTDTIWHHIDGSWIDTGETPKTLDRWISAMERRETLFLDLLRKRPA